MWYEITPFPTGGTVGFAAGAVVGSFVVADLLWGVVAPLPCCCARRGRLCAEAVIEAPRELIDGPAARRDRFGQSGGSVTAGFRR
jgi:hypothetical protein